MRIPIVPIVVAAAIIAGGIVAFRGSSDDAPQIAVGESSGMESSVTTPAPVIDFDVIRISREGSGVIAGDSEPGAFIDVLVDGVSIGKARASETGAWELVFAAPLQPGARALSLTATLPGGLEAQSRNIIVVAVPPAKTDGPTDDDGAIAVLTPRDGSAASRVLQRPGALRPKVEVGLDIIDRLPSGVVVVSGHSAPSAQVRLSLDGTAVGTASADDKGRWSLALEKAPGIGGHILRMDQIGVEDSVALRVEQVFDLTATLRMSPSDGKVAVVRDMDVWHVVRALPSGGTLYTQIFQLDKGQERHPVTNAPVVLR
ncbi:hypothetical protein [Iodidimonas sp. SYSU 1G8]|uniref:hypothetical protein n=1 Tax=Iodidimonas sp. SYSU 1G8 TaxID=3133967 RepID=UPI0031FEA452